MGLVLKAEKLRRRLPRSRGSRARVSRGRWDAEGDRLARAFANASLVLTIADPIVQTASFTDWLRRQGINPAQVHTLAVHEGEMIVKGYAVDARGSKYVDPDTGQGVEFKPFAVRLTEPLPGASPTDSLRDG